MLSAAVLRGFAFGSARGSGSRAASSSPFIVFGALGVFGYWGHLAYTVFKDSLLFPFALSALGLAIIWLGIYYQRHRTRIEGAIVALLPAGLRGFMRKQA